MRIGVVIGIIVAVLAAVELWGHVADSAKAGLKPLIRAAPICEWW
jgi:hypothetical protein